LEENPLEAENFASGGFRRERVSAADQVLDDLRSKILAGSLKRAAKLPSEKELASYYHVSSPTVREAIRALSAMGLVEVRHGSGTYVVAESSALMSQAMTAVVELEDIDLLSIFELSATLYQQAMIMAMDIASDEEILELRRAAQRFETAMQGDEFAAALEDFLLTFVGLSHNRLLIAMSAFLIETQIKLARASASMEPVIWKRIAGNLIRERLAMVEALESRNRDAGVEAVRAYMGRGQELVRENAGAINSATG
jgi:DNA-binding FadR family transcriptional regulator